MINLKNKNYHCWVSNITKRDVRLGDLGVCIRAGTTLDILDYRHSYLTIEQVKESIATGSLNKRLKQRLLIIRQSEPTQHPYRGQIDLSQMSFPGKHRSTITHTEPEFDEFDFTSDDDEAFAAEAADLTEIDRPINIQISTDSDEEDFK